MADALECLERKPQVGKKPQRIIPGVFVQVTAHRDLGVI